MRERDAAEMGADADQHQPLVLAGLDALLVGLRIGQAAKLDVARLVDLFLGAVADEDRLAAPEHLDDLALGDRGEVDLDRGAGGDRRSIRVHLRDQRHQRGGAADGGHRAGCDVEEIASCRLGRSCCHSPSPSLAVQPTRAENRERIAKTEGQCTVAVGPAALWPWGRTKGGDPAAFIGTLIKGVQARPGGNAQESHTSRTNPLPIGQFEH